jgi:NADH-quinone oxidoreductase subunit L
VLTLIPLLPFLGFLVNAFAGRRLPKGASGGVACGAMLGAFLVSVASVWRMLGLEPRAIDETVFTWIASGDFEVPLALRLDPLAAVMILVVTGIGFLIHVYSTGYMREEAAPEYARYFSYLNLFAAFMLVLVLGANLLVMFVGWEGVGLCSYLLIGFWFHKPSAADAGKKAFVVNRVGDFAFILGMLLAFVTFGTLDFQGIAREVSRFAPEAAFGVVSTICLLLFIGATGKSAQIPLFVWLPDAMEGPTPVSALIHAATMVTAGVYMIGRNAVLFEHAPIVLGIVALVGALTAFLAGTIGLVQNDIKRVLAYSTVSQLGYMFLAMGVGAFAAGIFHLYTHAFFKALLFLGSGAVIHALAGEQDLRRMGGLRHALPVTYWTFLIGALAIAGVPLLSGFFSKDEILFRTFEGGHTWLWLLAVVTSLMTAIYMFRLVFLAFFGEGPRGAADAAHGHGAPDHGGGHHTHLHDAPPSMAIPLVILAAGSILAGYVGVPHALGGANRIEAFLEPSFHVAEAVGEPAAAAAAEEAAHGPEGGAGLELTLMGVSTLVALGGIAIAVIVFLRRRAIADAIAGRFSGVYRLLVNKYYVDEIYDAAIVQPIKLASRDGLWRGLDATVIDGSVNGAGAVVRGWGSLLRRLQTGSVRTYAASLLLGAVLVIAYYLIGRR